MINGFGNIQKENSKKHLSDNRGTSMVTVIISFAVLLLLVTSYFRIQKVAENMMMNSRDMIRNNSQLIKEFYMNETTNKPVAGQTVLKFRGDSGGFFVNATLNQATDEKLLGSIYYFGTQSEEPVE